MSVPVILGAQWGDEGKGKIVDLFSNGFDYVARYQGGHNAGHTVIVDGTKYVFHLIPSGILHGCRCVLGGGMVIDPGAFLEEVKELGSKVDPNRLLISDQAHLITPWHVLVEKARGQVGTTGIGTTGRGIGPAYEDKMARVGIRAGSTSDPQKLRELAWASAGKWVTSLSPVSAAQMPQLVEDFVSKASCLAPFVYNTSSILCRAIKDGRKVLVEGAQGTMLDVDHGTYPFVTSSNTISGGACTGLGVPPTAINGVVGVIKAYTTRVGNGDFRTELFGEIAARIVEVGKERGASTGRPRRPGWIDLVQLRRAIELNGIQAFVLTKADVLSGFEKVKMCVAYELGESSFTDEYPADHDVLSQCQPQYKTEPGWGDITGITDYDRLPAQFRSFVALLEHELGIPVKAVSTGPERHQMIIRREVRVSGLEWMDDALAASQAA